MNNRSRADRSARAWVAPPQEITHGPQRLIADVVLNAFRIALGRAAEDPQRHEEFDDEFMAFSAGGGEPFSPGRQEDGAIWLNANQSVAVQPLNGLGDRHVRDAQAFGKINGARLALLVNQFVNEFDVVFGDDRGLLAPRRLENIDAAKKPRRLAGGRRRFAACGVAAPTGRS